GGDARFPRVLQAIPAARREGGLATYSFHDDPAARAVSEALIAAAARGVTVRVVVDGFGSIKSLPAVRTRFACSAVQLEVFRPLDRWWSWLQPGQLRRLHQKLCVCDVPGAGAGEGDGNGDGELVAFVGGINLIDDRHDLNHGWTEQPRLDFAVALQGPLAAHAQATARAMWTRAHLARHWRSEFRLAAASEHPVGETLALLQQLRGPSALQPAAPADDRPVRAAFLVRDNLRQRRVIERSYVDAIRQARQSVDIAVPYFYPGTRFRRALRRAAQRGVRVRLLLQGKVDYRIAALAAQAVYDELRGHGVRIFEYTPAFLHAKVARVDDDWATVGSSNIDPLSLLLNLEANVVVRDAGFAAELGARFEQAFALSSEVVAPMRRGLRGWATRLVVAFAATLYLRVAGITGRY
ncbi:MAG: phospholipase D-like domain-containing protein, partial [Rubrivivax sp.]